MSREWTAPQLHHLRRGYVHVRPAGAHPELRTLCPRTLPERVHIIRLQVSYLHLVYWWMWLPLRVRKPTLGSLGNLTVSTDVKHQQRTETSRCSCNSFSLIWVQHSRGTASTGSWQERLGWESQTDWPSGPQHSSRDGVKLTGCKCKGMGEGTIYMMDCLQDGQQFNRKY